MIDHVTLSNLHAASASAANRAEASALSIMAQHLRHDHGMSWVGIAERLGGTARDVRKMVEGDR